MSGGVLVTVAEAPGASAAPVIWSLARTLTAVCVACNGQGGGRQGLMGGQYAQQPKQAKACQT